MFVVASEAFVMKNTVVIVKIIDSMNHEMPINTLVGAMKQTLSHTIGGPLVEFLHGGQR
jgi:hypothetical protein